MLRSLDGYRTHAERQIDQIRRRVLAGEVIAHHEKVFSIFEPHTEWISKGKAGVPVELGLRVCILEDQQGFVLHHQVMEKQIDDQVAVSLFEQSQAIFPSLRVVSFDKGFHSPSIRQRIDILSRKHLRKHRTVMEIPEIPRHISTLPKYYGNTRNTLSPKYGIRVSEIRDTG